MIVYWRLPGKSRDSIEWETGRSPRAKQKFKKGGYASEMQNLSQRKGGRGRTAMRTHEYMEEDHKKINQLFHRFLEAKQRGTGEAVTIFLEFQDSLHRHVMWEEEVLFPLFEERTGMRHGPTTVMRTEHDEILLVLKKILEKIQSGEINTGTLEEKVAELTSAHQKWERQILYPWIDQQILPGEREEFIRKFQIYRTSALPSP